MARGKRGRGNRGGRKRGLPRSERRRRRAARRSAMRALPGVPVGFLDRGPAPHFYPFHGPVHVVQPANPLIHHVGGFALPPAPALIQHFAAEESDDDGFEDEMENELDDEGPDPNQDEGIVGDNFNHAWLNEDAAAEAADAANMAAAQMAFWLNALQVVSAPHVHFHS